MSDEDQTEDISQEELLDILKDLKLQHRRIDTEIAANQETGVIDVLKIQRMKKIKLSLKDKICLLYTSPSPRDLSTSRMPSSA